MKKLFSVITMAILATVFLFGCGASEYRGSVTALSEQFLTKGHIINVYRSFTPLSDNEEDYGKGYVTMMFQVLVDQTSTNYSNPNLYVVKQTVSQLKVKTASQMGIVGDLYLNYDSYGTNSVKVVGSSNKYVTTFPSGYLSGTQVSVAVELNHIAFVDTADYPESVTMAELYSALGITRDSVALTLSFRIELLTVDGTILYQDYEVEVPAAGFNISGSAFQTSTVTNEISLMEPFLEKQ